jgi:hypothetical protein
VNKSDGLVNIQVGIINEGRLRTSVAVNFFINQNQSGGVYVKPMNIETMKKMYYF